MSKIHPSAVIAPGAQIDESVEIGAYAVIGPDVRIGAGTRIGPHVVIEGHTTVGRDNEIFQFASIGAAPQDKKYAGEPTTMEIGDRNTIREFVTFNRGTVQDGGATRIGNDNWIMAYVHLAHDCQLGSHIILANNATLAGHVHLGDHVFLGGFTTVHRTSGGNLLFHGLLDDPHEEVLEFLAGRFHRIDPGAFRLKHILDPPDGVGRETGGPDHGVVGVGEKFVGRAFGSNAATVENDHSVADILDVGQQLPLRRHSI